jgi:hypothetical protein
MSLLSHRIALTTWIAYAKGVRHTLDACRPRSAKAASVGRYSSASMVVSYTASIMANTIKTAT